MEYDYNARRKRLMLPEYGRNVQKMINHIKTIENRDERNKAARTVIGVMQNMVPHGRDMEEFKHKLWDHLALISDFELDIDAPYDLPTKELYTAKPSPIAYNSNPIRFKHYGRGIELLIAKAMEMEAGEEKDRLVKLIANHMKRSYVTWNKSTVTDEVVLSDLKKISGGKLTPDKDLVLAESRVMFTKPRKKRPQRKK
ncbi:MAG: DUF4290 domain-containing protein [Bacteroidales bacterium]|nr:DUF4290 domain-containing protein [Bacteroidales bacterium]